MHQVGKVSRYSRAVLARMGSAGADVLNPKCSRWMADAIRATRSHPTSGPGANFPGFWTIRLCHPALSQEPYCRVKLATPTGLVEYPFTTAIASTFADCMMVKGPR